MKRNHDNLVSQKNPLRPYLWGAIIGIIGYPIVFFLSFPPHVFDIFVLIFNLVLFILFIVLYQRKLKYAWHSLLLWIILFYPATIYRRIIINGDPFVFDNSLFIWFGLILLALSVRKRYFKFIK